MMSTLMRWLTPRKKARIVAYRFLTSFPHGLVTPEGVVGPIKAGDILSERAMPREVWKVLLEEGAVEPYVLE